MRNQTTLGRFAIATTEHPTKPFCIFDRWEKRYIKDGKGLVCNYSTLPEAQKALSVMDDSQTA